MGKAKRYDWNGNIMELKDSSLLFGGKQLFFSQSNKIKYEIYYF